MTRGQLYAVCTTDRLETMLFVSTKKSEIASFMGLSMSGVESAIRRFRQNPDRMPVGTTKRLVIIPEEDIDA